MRIPNKITISRLLIHVPVLVVLVLQIKNYYLFSFILYLANMALDKVDGILARKLKQTTIIGRYLDSLVDKFTFHSLFVIFTVSLPEIFPLYIYLIILFRDLTVEILRQYTLDRNLEAKISPLGKFKALFLYISLGGGFVYILGYDVHLIITWLLWISLFFAFVSLADYLYSVRLSIKENI